jgi:hypothetical protein
MQMWPECAPCIDEMISKVAHMALDDQEVAEFMEDVRRLPALVDPSGAFRSPEVVRDAWSLLVARTGEVDPLADVKRRQNELALGLYETARLSVFESSDPFELAVRLAAAGNRLDAMVDVTGGPKPDLLDRVATMRVDPEHVEVFRARVAQARKIVYFGDNCGEIVFDRLFLEVIEAAAAVQVTFVTREGPVVNDATLTDALAVGLDAVADLVGNGISEPLPGTDLSKVSAKVHKLVEEADLVISKGGANYEMLDHEPELAGKTTFVLFGKCDPLCGSHCVERDDLIVFNY